jgi:type II secretory pathway pseudopilin PulG
MTRRQNAGFTLLETMVSLVVLLAVGGIVMSGMTQLMRTQGAIANRSAMHTSVRSVTELLQQEIGQAGKVSLSDSASNVTLNAAVAAGSNLSFALHSSTSTAATVYPGEVLTFDVGNNQEIVTLGGTSASPTGTFTVAHAAGAPVSALGAFATGVVPPATLCPPITGVVCGSTGTVLKLYGDINGDGNMVYVEYTCTQGSATAPGTFYRHQMQFDQTTAKVANDNTMILLSNVLSNPNDPSGNAVPCFAYQIQTLGSGTCVTNVAVTLTVQTQNKDLQTGQFQPETKALLNVAPRNVVEVYATANLVDPTRAQPIPATVTALLP